MDKEEIESLSEDQINGELFREMSDSWEKKDLIFHIINNLTKEERISWIKDWFNIEDD